MSELIDKVAGIEQHYEELGKQLEEAGSDYQRAGEIAKERSDLEELAGTAREYRQVMERIDEARSYSQRMMKKCASWPKLS